jgi:hypothetical protein
LNAIFHTYYLYLKRAIESFPWMTPNSLDNFRSLMKFYVDRHFIYIIARTYENKEDLEEITKEWPVEFLIPIAKAELSNPNLIGSLVVTHEEYNAPNSSKRNKNKDVQELRSDSEETVLDSPGRGGGDEVDKEEKEEKAREEDKQEQGEVAPPWNPLDDIDPMKKRKVSPMKPTSQKKSKAINPKLQTILTIDDFNFIIAVVLDASQDIL